ncbi:MAG TPA: SAM-dependent methyltransferase [Pseudonocardiaceae bacterium]|jgi:SAM-dependent methyltransferase|nr:SAM-dependent methyltransferase [Pseudonocardiaceae bacterium]
MNQYAMMVYPAANRVYAEASVTLLVSELGVFDERVLDGKLHDLARTEIGGVPYVTFTAPGLTDRELELLSNLSTLYALFGIEDQLLRPVPVRRLDLFDSDLLTIQKYAGKTNELFTKLLLNVTALSTDTPGDLVGRRLRVLDPLCGRGTTLNQAMMYGFDATGLDLDGKDFDEYSRFIRTWLKNKRIKHRAEVTPIRREHRQLGRRLDINVGTSKESYKAGDSLKLTYINGDTLRGAQFFRPGSFDLVVADAPYGVQHGARKGIERLNRNPGSLLAEALPTWASLLRPGGALGLSWNNRVLSRDELVGIVAGTGLAVLDSEPYLGFTHRVDQAIVRDILVAHKPS